MVINPSGFQTKAFLLYRMLHQSSKPRYIILNCSGLIASEDNIIYNLPQCLLLSRIVTSVHKHSTDFAYSETFIMLNKYMYCLQAWSRINMQCHLRIAEKINICDFRDA